jgi:N-methylhydantoinase B
VLDDEILSIILSNIRIADQRIGDIKAQAAALATGQARLGALLDRYGDATVDAAIVELKRRAARQMREKIATIADGVYEGEAFVDSDGVVDEPLRIAMRITKTGGSDVERAALSFDMSGSSPPCQGPMNSVIATTRSSIYLAVKHVFPEAAINAGTFEPLHIVDPEGTFLYAHYPASGLGLRRRGKPAHRRGGVRRARPGDSPTSCSARRRERAATSASAASIPRRTAPT